MYRFFFSKNKSNCNRIGFSLAEALVMVIIVGSALVPIMGTFTDSVRITQNFDHREKLRILARTRLNQEIANAAYDQSAVDFTTHYHYLYYDDQTPANQLTADTSIPPADFLSIATVTEILYAYRIDVELKEQFSMASINGLIVSDSLLKNISGLKAIVVKAEIGTDYVTATETVSHFSLISTPSYEGNFIYLADSTNLAVTVIDPNSKTVIETYQIPKLVAGNAYNNPSQDPVRPWNLAVHPGGKVIVYQSKQKLHAINIDKDSSAYGSIIELYNFGHDIAAVSATDGTAAADDRGVAFRPDGRYGYVTDHTNQSIHTFQLTGLDKKPITWPLTYTAIHEKTGLGTNLTTAFTAGNDGWLYVGLKDLNKVFRMQMYPLSMTSPKTQDTGSLSSQSPAGTFNVVGISSSVDGKYTYLCNDKGGTSVLTLMQLGSNYFKPLGSASIDLPDGDTSDMVGSADSKYIMFTDIFGAVNKGGGRVIDISGINFPAGAAGPPVHEAYPNSRQVAYQLCLSPNLKEFLWISETNQMHFANIEATMADSYTSGIPPENTITVTATNVSSSDVRKRNVQYCLVGCDDQTIQFVDIYARKTEKKKIIEGLRGGYNAYSLAVSPHDDKIRVGYGVGQTGVDTYNMDGTVDSTNFGLAKAYGQAFLATDSYTNLYATIEHDPVTTGFNGSYLPGMPVPTGLPGGKCIDVDLSVDWVAQQVVPLNKGGFLLLYKNDGGGALSIPAGTTLLDWVGEHKWNSDPRKAGNGADTWPVYKGKYERFARWVSSADGNFPPEFATKMAISADDSLLALSTEKPNDERVYIFDFNAQNFGALTQMEGLIINHHGVLGTNPAVSFDIPVYSGSVFTGSGIPLAQAFTTNEPFLTNLKVEPFNFYSTPAAAPTTYPVASRIFGYFRPATTVYRWGSGNADGCMFYIHGLLAGVASQSKIAFDWCSYGYNNVGPVNRQVDAYTVCFVQSEHPDDHVAADGQSIMYATSAAQVWSNPTYAVPKYDSVAGWNHVKAAETTPFLFRPQLMFEQQFGAADATPDGAPMVFSRDRSDPILYLLNSYDGYIHTIRIGKGMHKINLPAGNYLNHSIAISPDGQRLILGRDTEQKVMIVNISSPYLDAAGAAYDFGSDVNPSASTNPNTIGTITAQIALGAQPTCLATLPFRSYASKTDYYEPLVATLPSNLSGCNLAAAADSGIYILGGSEYETGAGVNQIWRFNPVNNTVASLPTVLKKAVNRHAVVAYNNDVYAIGGNAGATTDWVQRYCIASAAVESSFDGGAAGAVNFKVSVNDLTSGSSHSPVVVTDSGNIRNYFFHDYYGWEAFDGDTGVSNGWGATSLNNSIYYDFGAGRATIVNNLWVDSDFTGSDEIDGYAFYGSNTGTGGPWTPITTGNIPSGATNYSSPPFTNPAPTPYRYYRFESTSSHSTYAHLREIRFWLNNLRRVSPVNMTGYTSGSITVSATEEHAPIATKQEYAWKAFDGDLFTPNFWCDAGNRPATFTSDLGAPDIINVIRIKIESNSSNSFRFWGSNNGTTWTAISFGTSPDINNLSFIGGQFELFCVDNTTAYRYYALERFGSGDNHLTELEYYSTTNPPPTEDVLTKVMGDDRVTIPFEEGAACMTPYGIFMGGGLNGSALDDTLIYWPQGIATHSFNGSGYRSWGISRQLPNMAGTRRGFTFVWHKGYVYRIGGGLTSAASMLTTTRRFNFQNNAWEAVTHPGALFERYKAAACSFGDEIFIFGGQTSGGSYSATAAAWNPETGAVRTLTTVPGGKTYAMTAVPFGGSIYLIGGSSAVGSGGGNTIIKYTP